MLLPDDLVKLGELADLLPLLVLPELLVVHIRTVVIDVLFDGLEQTGVSHQVFGVVDLVGRLLLLDHLLLREELLLLEHLLLLDHQLLLH